MAVYLLDVEVQSIITYGLDYIRQNLHVLDEVFANLKEGHLNKLYGDKEIQKIKDWFTNRNIPVRLGFNLQPQDVPCYSVHLAQSVEDVGNAFYNDWAGTIEENTTPRVIVPSFVPESYNESLGTINVPEGVDLSLVRVGHHVKDNNNNVLPIIDLNGQVITITMDDMDADLDFSNITIQSFISTDIYKRGEAYFNEQIDIGVHAVSDQNTVLWMYSILVYILFRFKMEIMTRCMDLSTFSASDFNRDSQYLGNNIFSRWVRLSARTRVSWKEDELNQVDTLVSDVDVEVEDC